MREAEPLGPGRGGRQTPRTSGAYMRSAMYSEMQGRNSEGINWYEKREVRLGCRSAIFAVHNAWHLSLYPRRSRGPGCGTGRL